MRLSNTSAPVKGSVNGSIILICAAKFSSQSVANFKLDPGVIVAFYIGLTDFIQ